MDFDIASTAACSWIKDKSSELAFLMTQACDFQSQMMILKAHDEMEDSHCMASLNLVFSTWKELPRVPA